MKIHKGKSKNNIASYKATTISHLFKYIITSQQLNVFFSYVPFVFFVFIVSNI